MLDIYLTSVVALSFKLHLTSRVATIKLVVKKGVALTAPLISEARRKKTARPKRIYRLNAHLYLNKMVNSFPGGQTNYRSIGCEDIVIDIGAFVLIK